MRRGEDEKRASVDRLGKELREKEIQIEIE